MRLAIEGDAIGASDAKEYASLVVARVELQRGDTPFAARAMQDGRRLISQRTSPHKAGPAFCVEPWTWIVLRASGRLD